MKLNCKTTGRFLCTVFGTVAAWAASAGENLIFRPDAQWRPVEMKQLEIAPGSALDLSGWNDAPAGKHGRVLATPEGELAFADAPDKAVRFFGFNWITGAGMNLEGSAEESRNEIFRFARAVRRQGYNIIRLHALDIFLMDSTTRVDGVFSPRRLEQFDRMVEAFKAEGIYLYLDFGMSGWVHGGWSGRACENRVKIFFNDDNSRELWEKSVLALLNHRNPESGLALRDEPAVAVVLFWNEQDLTLLSPSLTQAPAERIQEGFRAWLKQKYGTFEALRSAWKTVPENAGDFAAIKMNHTSRVAAGPVREDMTKFYLSLMDETLNFYRSVLEKSGYRGLYTLWDAAKNRRSSVAREALPLLCSHDYTAHPSDWMRPGSRVGQESSLSGLWYFRTMAQTRQWGKPFMITEYGHGFWNPFVHEAGLAMAGYSALQNYSGLMVHCNAVLLRPRGSLQDFGQGLNPVTRANEFLAAHLFRRSDVAPSRKKLEIRISPRALTRDGLLESAVNAEQTKLALVAGFGISVSDKPGKSFPDNVLLSGERGSETTGTAWTNTLAVSKTPEKYSLAAEVTALKRQGVLPRGNRTDPEKGLFESSTGELLLSFPETSLRVVTPRTEAVSMLPGRCALGVLRHVSTDVPAAVALISRDGKPLTGSGSLVLLYSTDSANSDMELSPDRTTLVRRGELPALLKNGKFEVTLRRAPEAAPLRCFALRLDGGRSEELPLVREKDGTTLKIDTSALLEYTPFFELTTQP